MNDYPELRPLNVRWAEAEGNQFLVLEDPLRLTDHALMVPGPLASFLGLLEGRETSAPWLPDLRFVPA